MSWVATSFAKETRRDVAQLSPGFSQAGDLLVCGSIVVEFTTPLSNVSPEKLLFFETTNSWTRKVEITILNRCEIRIHLVQGVSASISSLVVPFDLSDTSIRLTYAWNGPAKNGIISVENLDTGVNYYNEFTDPIPMPLGDINTLVTTPEFRSKHVTLVAASDQMESAGLTPGIGSGTVVQTRDGQVNIERLSLGDEVLTANSGYKPVQWIVQQDLPAQGAYAPIGLRAPYLGLDQDIIVAPHQHMLITGAEAEYLFGQDSVLIKAKHLPATMRKPIDPNARSQKYFQIVLDCYDCICLSGGWGESTYVNGSPLARSDLNHTNLAAMPESARPSHRKMDIPVLQKYEAMALLADVSACN